MILKDTVRPLFSSSTLLQTGLLALAMGAYSLLPVLKQYSAYRNVAAMPSDMHAVLSLVLGALLIFRTNSAYSRWWEARTPFVRSYRIFARQCVILFLISLPWGVANDFQWWTVPLTMIMAYFMIGMEIVAEHTEEPFGHDDDDLDLEGLCETMERSVNAIFSNARLQIADPASNSRE